MCTSDFWTLSTIFKHLAMPIFETFPAFALVDGVSENAILVVDKWS